MRVCAEDEPVDVMPGSGRQVFGPRRKLVRAMEAAGVAVAGALPPVSVNRYLFLLTTIWSDGPERRAT